MLPWWLWGLLSMVLNGGAFAELVSFSFRVPGPLDVATVVGLYLAGGLAHNLFRSTGVRAGAVDPRTR